MNAADPARPSRRPGTISVAHGWSWSNDGRNNSAGRLPSPNVSSAQFDSGTANTYRYTSSSTNTGKASIITLVMRIAVVDRPAAPPGRDRAERHAQHEPGDRDDAEQPQRVRRRGGDDVGHLAPAQVGAEVAVQVVAEPVEERPEARVARLVVARVVEAVARLDGGELRRGGNPVAEEGQRRVAVELDGERRQQVEREHDEEQREAPPGGTGERCSGPSGHARRCHVVATSGLAVVAHLQQAQLDLRR